MQVSVIIRNSYILFYNTIMKEGVSYEQGKSKIRNNTEIWDL